MHRRPLLGAGRAHLPAAGSPRGMRGCQTGVRSFARLRARSCLPRGRWQPPRSAATSATERHENTISGKARAIVVVTRILHAGTDWGVRMLKPSCRYAPSIWLTVKRHPHRCRQRILPRVPDLMLEVAVQTRRCS
eukprot:2917412-Pleurochrysis_carterae.AAC.1